VKTSSCSTGLWRSVDFKADTNVSEKRNASNFRAKDAGAVRTRRLYAWGPHGVTSQEMNDIQQSVFRKFIGTKHFHCVSSLLNSPTPILMSSFHLRHDDPYGILSYTRNPEWLNNLTKNATTILTEGTWRLMERRQEKGVYLCRKYKVSSKYTGTGKFVWESMENIRREKLLKRVCFWSQVLHFLHTTRRCGATLFVLPAA
jgi:hypothetical protein